MDLSAECLNSRAGTYDGDFATKLILNFSLLKCIWTFLLDDREELFNTHLGGLRSSQLLVVVLWIAEVDLKIEKSDAILE